MLTSVNKLNAQDTISRSYSLSPVDIIHSPVIRVSNPGLIIEKPDSLQTSRFQQGTLTDLLSGNGILFLKSYGGGNLATTTIRGASASQTSVFWNGINLQSPTNGNVDLSLIPAILCDNISIQNGGGSAGLGSGAIGGAIQTGNETVFGKGFNLKYVGLGGSFNQLENGIRLGYSNERLSTNFRVYHQVAENNFEFKNTAWSGSPIDTVSNSDFLQQGIFGEISTRSTSHEQYLYVRAWYQRSDRGIPATMQETQSSTRQNDEFFRAVADWRILKSAYTLQIKSAVFTEFMDFIPGYSQPNSLTHSISFINEADFIFRVSKKITPAIGITNTFSKADVTQYVPSTDQDRSALFASVNYKIKETLNLALQLREEEVSGKFTPLIGSLGADWWHYKFLTLRTSLSRNYRLPTFNDLYWQPGGNPELKPEESWNEDFSTDIHFSIKNISYNYIVSVYNRNTTNWIQWQPGPGYWSPENLLEVWSRGIENRIKIKWSKNKTEIALFGGYDYVRATSEKSKSPSDVSIGKQLVYLPANNFSGMIQLTYRKIYFACNYQYTDIRFTTTDHTSYLPGFDLAAATIGTRIEMKNSYADVFIRGNNLFNKTYQAVAWRPMPGRNFQIGLTIDLHKPNTNAISK
ncbi:TonB-dependent receptor plug domain-containing protein [soil metagenome]